MGHLFWALWTQLVETDFLSSRDRIQTRKRSESNALGVRMEDVIAIDQGVAALDRVASSEAPAVGRRESLTADDQ